MMREKYIETRFPRWFAFGTYPNGHVDINDGTNDVVEDCTRERAEWLIAEREKLIDMLVAVTQALHTVAPQALKLIWYGAPTREEREG